MTDNRGSENHEREAPSADELAATDESAEDRRQIQSYTLTCSPLDRVTFLCAMLISPVGAIYTLVGLRDTAEVTGVTVNQLLASSNARFTMGLVLLLTIFILIFCPLYLQYRARARLELDEEGVRFKRGVFLPFSLLTRDIQLKWEQVDEIRYRYRILPMPMPLLELRHGRDWLTLPVPHLWDESVEGRRPWKTPAPKGGWSDHRAVKYVQDRFVDSRASLAAKAAD